METDESYRNTEGPIVATVGIGPSPEMEYDPVPAVKIGDNRSQSQKAKMEKLLRKNVDIFDHDNNHGSIEHRVVTNQTEPINCPPRRLPAGLINPVNEAVDLLHRGQIEQSRKAKANYNNKINEILSDPITPVKKWWRVAKSFYGNKAGTSIHPLFENGQYIYEPKDKAEIFNEYFVSQTFLPTVQIDMSMFSGLSLPTDIIAIEEEVVEILAALDVSKACGVDVIGNRLIKLCAMGLYKPLTHLINLSFVLGQFPSQWKLGNVLPLFKRDNRQLKDNYRPVSLLPCFGKICEKIVFKRVYCLLESTGFFYRLQSGFRPGNSTVMQLVYIVSQIYETIDRGNEIRAVFLDISKAFDRVWHDGLLYKLKQLGIDGTLSNGLKGEGAYSSLKEIQAGVPQGSVLGPLLFLIYVNDITDNLDSRCFLFADDTLLLDEVFSPEETANKLNNDLQTISSWADKWLVRMNASKTKSMIFSLKREKSVHPSLFMDDRVIDEIQTHRHLGVSLCSDISWKTQYFNQRPKN